MRTSIVDILPLMDTDSKTPLHAHWILDGNKMGIVYKYKCSYCGNRDREKSNYCSHCGRRMDEPTQSNNSNTLSALE